MRFVLLALLASLFVVAVGRSCHHDLQRTRSKRTTARLRDLANAIETDATNHAGRYPCVRGAAELPSRIVKTLPENALIDGWGNPIAVRISQRSYVVASMGSDGIADRSYPSKTFGDEDDHRDIVYSNGELIQYPEGISVIGYFSPRVEDALADASDCSLAPIPPCVFELYFPSEAQARSAMSDVIASGYTAEARPSRAAPNWRVTAARVNPNGCDGLEPALDAAMMKHSGLYR